MDTLKELPNQYFEDKPSIANYDLEGGDYSLVPEALIENDDIFKMPGEETKVDSRPATPYGSNTTVTETNPITNTQKSVNDIYNNKEPFTNNNEEVLNQIKNIDDKLFDLEKQLYNIDNNIPENNQTNILNKDFFNNQDIVTREVPVEINSENNPVSENNPPQQINADYVNNDSLSNYINNESLENINSGDNNIVEVQNRPTNKKNILLTEINNLNKIRKDLISNIKKSNSTNNFNPVNNNTQQLNQNSFTPNFAFTNDQQFDTSVERAIESEKTFNNNENVKVVSDDFGNPAVISEDQVNLKQAIDEHGGLDKGIQDSVEKQNFTENFSKFSNSENNTDNIFNAGNSNISLEDNVFNDSYPDNFSDISKNTEATVTAVNALSKKISELSKSISTGFKGLNGSIKNIESTQNNMVNNYEGGTSNYPRSQSMPQKNKSTIPKVGGDSPLPQDFPDGFTPGGSNL